jgi:hypothetical protein
MFSAFFPVVATIRRYDISIDHLLVDETKYPVSTKAVLLNYLTNPVGIAEALVCHQ